jgi:hypothetical protein
MTIQTYVKKNYEKLPKSTFNEDELVIVEEISRSDEGWGHHSYNGIGVDRSGQVYWCFSSGCSCDGTCGVEHKQDLKKFVVEGYDLSKIDWKNVDFGRLQVDYKDYG